MIGYERKSKFLNDAQRAGVSCEPVQNERNRMGSWSFRNQDWLKTFDLRTGWYRYSQDQMVVLKSPWFKQGN